MMQEESYWILEELDRRVQKNSQYSLRAFARDLHVVPSYLTAIFQGKTQLNSKTVIRLLDKVSYSKENRNLILNNYKECEKYKLKLKKRIDCITDTDNKKSDMKCLSIEEYKKIMSWDYCFVFSLLKKHKDDFKNLLSQDYPFLSQDKFKTYIQQFKDLGLIEINDNSVSFLFKGHFIKATGDEIGDDELWNSYLHSSKYIFEQFLNTNIFHEQSCSIESGWVLELFNLPEESFLAAEKLIGNFQSQASSLFSFPESLDDEQCVINYHFSTCAKNEVYHETI